MKKEELLEKIAPCSLVCYTCASFEKGIICESANKLLHSLDGILEFYEKHCPDKTENCVILKGELEAFGAGVCSGCRNREHHGCSIQGCFILDCTKEHGADFCGECRQFPCEKVRELFEEEVYLQWLEGNEEIRSLGIEEFWNRACEKPHYKAYKKKPAYAENKF